MLQYIMFESPETEATGAVPFVSRASSPLYTIIDLLLLLLLIITIIIITTFRIQNPDTPRAGRVGAAHGEAAGRGGARVGRDAVMSIRPGDNPSLLPSSESRKCFERLFGSTNSLIRS